MGSVLKIHAMIKIVQQCETSSAKAFCLFFDEEKGEDGERRNVMRQRDGQVGLCEQLQNRSVQEQITEEDHVFT